MCHISCYCIFQLPVVVGLAYVVITDKWEELRLKAETAARAENERNASEIPDTDVEGTMSQVSLTYSTILVSITADLLI